MTTVYNSQLDAFDLYHKIQEKSSSSALNGPTLPALGHAFAGSTGTAISNLAIFPLDLITTRLQVQRQLRKSSKIPDEGEYKSVLDAFKQIYKKEGGLAALYTGLVQDTGKSIADSFLFFLFYNYLRADRLQKYGGNTTTLPALDELTVGALAGACSKFFTTPISNIVTRKQTASLFASRSGSPYNKQPSVKEIFNKIKKQKGIRGFWSGYSASLVLTLNPGITFFLYEFFKRTILPRSKRDDPGARTTFILAATSKAIASTITYPFSLAKARAQAGPSSPSNPELAKQPEADIKYNHATFEGEKFAEDAKNFTKRSTVFNTILNIYREEGLEALYEGIFGEIIKGFFSHGITMLVKEAIHKLIIQAYYLLLQALKKYPSPQELAQQAGDSIKEGYADVSERIGVMGSSATEAGKTMGSNVADAARDIATRVGAVGTFSLLPLVIMYMGVHLAGANENMDVS
ncbi:mitochondrial carrier domain-containing protein [Tricladium varicosporioides]|nr:mitochondrial carrier domain-containing protein [Hymenoscyphus varicosporioides]